MKKQLKVSWWTGATVGYLIHRGPIYFFYDPSWIKTGHNLSPLCLPFTDIAFNGDKGVDKLPGLIADCLPDSWGIKLARKIFSEKKWGEPTTLGLLSWRGNRGLGAFNFEPSLTNQESDPLLESIHTEALARGAWNVERDEPDHVLPQLVKGGTAGGAYPKSLVLSYPDGTIKVGHPDGTGKPSLLKFDFSKTNQTSRLEHAYALMANAAGIQTVKTSLLKEKKGEKKYHLLVDRFDVSESQSDGRRFHFHSLAGLLHRGAMELDYRDFLRSTIKLQCDPREIKEVVRRMIFNVLSSNHDDHGKNHGFIYDENRRRWSLSPAYDMTPSQVVLERGMTICGEVWPSLQVMKNLAREAGISSSEFREIQSEIEHAISRWKDFADQAEVASHQEKEIRNRLNDMQIKIN